MRLEAGHEPARLERARGLERGPHLGGVVRVVVHHPGAGGRAPVVLEAAGGAHEARQCRRGLRRRHARHAHGRDRRERVEHVVSPRHRQLHRRAVHAEARAPGKQLHLFCPHVAGLDAERQRLALAGQGDPGPQHPHLGRRRELRERLLELAERAVGGVVVELDVGHHRHVAGELEERAVRLVGLGHDPVALAPARIGPAGAHLAAHDEGRVASGLEQHVGDHGRGGGLAVGAGHRDRALEPRELAQQVAAVAHRGAGGPGRGELGVVIGDRGGHNHLGPLGHIRRVVSQAGLDAGLAQQLAIGRVGTVRARHLRAERVRHEREAAHSRAADAHEVQPASGQRRLAHRGHDSPRVAATPASLRPSGHQSSHHAGHGRGRARPRRTRRHDGRDRAGARQPGGAPGRGPSPPQDGQTFTAKPGQWDGPPGMTIARQWLRCDSAGEACQAIPSATATTYALGAADAGGRVKVRETATCQATTPLCQPKTSDSGASALILNDPVNQAAPQISGDAQARQLLSASVGFWRSPAPLSFGYQWIRCDAAGTTCSNLPGAVGPDYRVLAADRGATLRVVITARNSRPRSATAVSAPTLPVAAAPGCQEGAPPRSPAAVAVPENRDRRRDHPRVGAAHRVHDPRPARRARSGALPRPPLPLQEHASGDAGSRVRVRSLERVWRAGPRCSR